MQEHIVKSYDQELAQLDKKIAQMGGLVERLVAQGFEALEKRDPQLAEAAAASDRAIDTLERDIQELAILMIAKRQPLANDLRHVMTVLGSPATWSVSATWARTSPSARTPCRARAIPSP